MEKLQMDIISAKIDNIVQNLLVPVRTERKLDSESFELFFEYLDELLDAIRGEEMITRRLTGLLFFIYTSLSGYVRNDDYKDPIFMQVSKLEGYLSEIYWDSPFGKY